MSSVNKVILIGNLGTDPEAKIVGETKVCKFTMATTENYKTKEGEKKSQTEWHDVEVWGNLANIVEMYTKKGDKLYVEGKIVTDSWEAEDGTKKYRTKIKANQIQMLTPKGGTGAPAQQQSTSGVAELENSGDNDDLPF